MQDNTMTPLQKLDKQIDRLVEEDCRQDFDSKGDYCNIVTELFIIDLKQQLANWFIETLKECLGEKEEWESTDGVVNEDRISRNKLREQALATALKVMEVKK